MSLKGKVALVTGGAQGIGRAFVESLLQEGASVAICDYNKEAGEEAAKELNSRFDNRTIFLYCDVTKDSQIEESIKATIDELSGLDILVNNAGIANETEEGWKRVIDVNLVAVIVGTRLGLKYMSKNNGGRGGIIVNIASITSLEKWPPVPIYSCTKAAVNQLTRSYGDELYFNKTGVKVISINPGMTKTALTSKEVEHAFEDDEIFEAFVKRFVTYVSQSPENLGKGLIQILQNCENGSMWTIENGEPPKRTILT